MLAPQGQSPRTDIRPTSGRFKHCTTISPTIQQPLSNPAQTIGNFNQSPTVLQPPHQPSFNRLPTTTHTLLARASSHLPRAERTSPSIHPSADLRLPQNIHPPLTSSSPALLTLLTPSPAPQPSASDQGWTSPAFSDLKTNLSSTRMTPIILSAMRPANGTTSLCGFCQDLI